MIKKLLINMVKLLPSLTIKKGESKYLTRYYALLKDREFGNIFIHHFHRSDMDIGEGGLGLLHCHPFEWSIGFILSGGYWEERRMPGGVVIRRLVAPFTFNFLSKHDYHRVDLVDEQKGAWTIFITGSRKGNSWDFWDRKTRERIFWRDVPGAIE